MRSPPAPQLVHTGRNNPMPVPLWGPLFQNRLLASAFQGPLWLSASPPARGQPVRVLASKSDNLSKAPGPSLSSSPKPQNTKRFPIAQRRRQGEPSCPTQHHLLWPGCNILCCVSTLLTIHGVFVFSCPLRGNVNQVRENCGF